MARVIKCDLCGSIYEERSASGLVYKMNSDRDGGCDAYDLCPQCTKEHLNFLPEKEKE